MLTCLLLRSECAELLLHCLQVLGARLLAILFFFQGLLALLLFAEFVALLFELFQALGDLLIELHEGRRGITA
ncbi:hypothetical protein D3C84_511040 [compost metagenome]